MIPAPKKRAKPEADLARLVVEYLALDGWRAVKMEPLARRDWGKGSGEVGMPDYLFLRYAWTSPLAEGDLIIRLCEHVFIEFKSKNGRVSDKQREWHAAERARGALVLVAKEDFEPTLDGFVKFYESSGLQRRAVRMKGQR